MHRFQSYGLVLTLILFCGALGLACEKKKKEASGTAQKQEMAVTESKPNE